MGNSRKNSACSRFSHRSARLSHVQACAQAAAENHVLLEINNSSYKSGGYRTGSRENAKIMLASCKKYGTSVIMSSDAHIEFDVGNHKLSQEVIAENNFPAELVVNADTKKFFEFVNYRKSLVP